MNIPQQHLIQQTLYIDGRVAVHMTGASHDHELALKTQFSTQFEMDDLLVIGLSWCEALAAHYPLIKAKLLACIALLDVEHTDEDQHGEAPSPDEAPPWD